jgi:hypothetical protein
LGNTRRILEAVAAVLAAQPIVVARLRMQKRLAYGLTTALKPVTISTPKDMDACTASAASDVVPDAVTVLAVTALAVTALAEAVLAEAVLAEAVLAEAADVRVAWPVAAEHVLRVRTEAADIVWEADTEANVDVTMAKPTDAGWAAESLAERPVLDILAADSEIAAVAAEIATRVPDAVLKVGPTVSGKVEKLADCSIGARPIAAQQVPTSTKPLVTNTERPA